MRERNHPETWRLKRFVPFGLAALLVGAACGAPDEVRRVVQTGGQTAGAGGSAGTTISTGTGGAATGGASATAPASSADSGGKSGGGNGGKGGSSVSSKGGSTSGGTSAKSSGAGGSGGSKSTFPSVGGSSGGKTAVGGATGSTGGTTSTGSEPAPTDSLAAYLAQKPSGSPNQLGLALQVVNSTSQPVDLTAVTLRYWYQDQGEGLGDSATLQIDDARIGDSTSVKDKITGIAVAAPSPVAGADHFLQISFTGITLAGKGAGGNADRLSVGGRLHNSSYTGSVDLSNDYSYNAGAIGPNDKITLHSGGKVIWGTPPGEGGGGGGTPSPDAGAADGSAGN